MDAYEVLANAIITQAADDYRKAAKFLKKNPRTKELEDRVAARLAKKKKLREEHKKGRLPVGKEKKSVGFHSGERADGCRDGAVLPLQVVYATDID